MEKILERIAKSVEQQSKNSEKVLKHLARIEIELQKINKSLHGSGAESVKSFIDSAVIAKMLLSIESILAILSKEK